MGAVGWDAGVALGSAGVEPAIPAAAAEAAKGLHVNHRDDAIGYALTREHYLALKVRGKILAGVKPTPDLQKESTLERPAWYFRMYSRPVQISRAHYSPFLDNRKQTPHRHSRPGHVS